MQLGTRRKLVSPRALCSIAPVSLHQVERGALQPVAAFPKVEISFGGLCVAAQCYIEQHDTSTLLKQRWHIYGEMRE